MILPAKWVFNAHVEKVVDGDTLKLNVDLGFRTWVMGENFRVARINAPEIRRDDPAGALAREWVEKQLTKPIQIHSSKHGKYRWVIEVFYGDKFELNLSDEMVKAGHAEYVNY